MTSTGLRVSNNALNQNERSKLTKRSQKENADSKINEPLPAKRAALGTLSSNNIRIQPFRAAKVCIETVCDKIYSSSENLDLRFSLKSTTFYLFGIHFSLQAQAPTASHRNSSEANVFAKVAHSAFNVPPQGFSVYIDKDTSKPKTSSSGRLDSLDLDPVVTALSRQPLTEVFSAPSIQNHLYGMLLVFHFINTFYIGTVHDAMSRTCQASMAGKSSMPVPRSPTYCF